MWLDGCLSDISFSDIHLRSEWGTTSCEPNAVELNVKADGHLDVRMLAVLSLLSDLAVPCGTSSSTSMAVKIMAWAPLSLDHCGHRLLVQEESEPGTSGNLALSCLDGRRALVLELLFRRCSEMLGAFPTTLAEDEAMLFSSQQQVSATTLIYRMGKKQVLQGCMAAMRAAAP